MISKCSVVTVEKQFTAVVKAKVPFAEIPQTQRAARARIDAGLPSLDTGMVGLACTRWLPPQDGVLDMEMGTIVARPIEAKGEIVPSELPAGRAELQPAGINWEVYGPAPADPTRQETHLYALLA